VNVMRRAKGKMAGQVMTILAVACIGLSGASIPSVAAAASPSAGLAAAGAAKSATLRAAVSSRSDQSQSSAQCVIGPDTTSCTSTDPTLAVEWTNFSDTTGCMFNYTISWGDGTTQSGNVAGGPARSYVLASHTYKSPGTYTESLTGSVQSGTCMFYPGTAQFTYSPALTFTVQGSLPVLPSESEDTYAQAPPGSVCRNGPFLAAKGLGKGAVLYFDSIGAPDAATLLENFLAGTFKPINFPDGSTLSQDLLKNSEFQSLNQNVQMEIQRQLNAGTSGTINLPDGKLKRLVLNDPTALYWAFAGTQGLVITGKGSVVNGNYVGTLTYKVEDSYGFTKKDYFHGVGVAMRYLQTTCGNPPYQGGAHWFADSVTATVNFKLPVGSSLSCLRLLGSPHCSGPSRILSP
jgi:hypothetical protein